MGVKKRIMVTTELKPLLLNLSDDDEDETVTPIPPEEEEEGGAGKIGGTTEEDGFDLDENLIETPGEEEF